MAALLFFLCSLPGHAETTVVGSDGVAVTLAQPAERIITLAPHLTELVFAAGAGGKLVGVARYSNYPLAARDIPRVGDAYRVDLERIVALRPDLVIVWESGTSARAVDTLRNLDLRVWVVESQRLRAIPDLIEHIGDLAGTASRAQKVSAAFRGGMAALRRQYAKRPTVSVFYQISAQPLFTLGGEHFLDEVITLCGGENIFSGLNVLAPRVSEEAVLARHPEVIIAGVQDGQSEVLARWRGWPQLPAVDEHNLFTLPADLLHRPTPRLLEGARLLCEALEQSRS